MKEAIYIQLFINHTKNNRSTPSHPNMEKIIIIIYKILKFYDFFIFKKIFVTILIFFKPNIIKFWTKLSNKPFFFFFG